MEMSMKKYALVLGAALLLAGCGSSVKLDNVPVEDRTATSQDANATAQSAVTSVNLDKNPNEVFAAGQRAVYFDFDSFVIKPESQPLIEAHARYLKANKTRKAALEGHADERGGREYNLALGQKRAEAVRRALGLLGVADNQLEAVSFGKEKPAVQGSDEAAWAKNRRVEFGYR
jgi:peptidoglycan-associated lipoprotein